MEIMHKLGVGLSVVTLTLMSGCTSYRAIYQKANDNSELTQNQITAAKTQEQLDNDTIIEQPGHYVNKTAIPLQKLPSWAYKKISLHAEEMPFNRLLSKVLDETSAYTSYQSGTASNQLITMDYTGTIRGALDKLAAKSGLNYTIEGNQIQWSEFLTKTFNISFIPGESKYFLGKKAGEATKSTTSGESVSGQSSDSDQFSSLQGTVSVWRDLTQTINSLLSKDGKAIVSEATTSVTIHDHVENVRSIGEYLKQLNKNLSEQVAIKVRVLEIDLNENFNLGIRWDLVREQLGQSFSLTGDGTAMGVANNLSGGLTLLGGGRMHGTALLNALGRQGKLNIVTEPQVVTMNNQVSEISITTQRAYLAKVETTTTSGLGNATQTSLTPGNLTTGFSLYLLPKIQGNNIYLQITSGLSTLTEITEQKASQEVNANKIQTPTIDEKRFNQRTVVPTGSTLILAGFKQVKTQNANSSLFGSTALGGHGGNNVTTEIIILISPTIVRNQY